jgi:CRP-like cAMP-binding protein
MDYVLFVSESAEGVSVHLADRVPPQDWADLIAAGVPVHFLDRQVLFHQGDAGRHVYVLRRGAVKVVRGEPDGEQTILTVRSGGDVLGDFAALDRGPRSATVIALGPVTAQLVTAQQFQAFVNRPSVAPGFTRYTVDRLHEADVQRGELAMLPVKVRLARTLLRLADESVVRMAQQDIARYLGASRNAVVEELSLLRAAGVIDTGRQAIVVRDPERLRLIARL